jgi:hypothetical protein
MKLGSFKCEGEDETFCPYREFNLGHPDRAGGWRILHIEELINLYASPNVIRVSKSMGMRWAKHVARMRQVRNAYNILVEKPEGKRPLGRP